MNAKNPIRVLIASTLLFAVLFHNKAMGINLVLFESAMLAWLFYTKQLGFTSALEKWMTLAQVGTLAFTIIHHSIWSYVIHFFVSFLLVGVMIAPKVRSVLTVVGMALSNSFMCFHELFVKEERPISKTQSRRKYQIKRLQLYFIPVGIIILFAVIYGLANPEFGTYIDAALGWISDAIYAVFEAIDFWLFMTLFFGFILTVFVLRRGKNTQIEELELKKDDALLRTRNRQRAYKPLALKNELRAGIFLFVSLNILLFAMNAMDIHFVWFNFEWEGQYLRQFVHEGTLFLIIALMLSLILVLHFFRRNLNFYSKSKTLKWLCYVWLGQNAILAVSAGIRNFYYIQYYALAYKRVAIVFFLLLTIYGLISVYLKVKNTRSNFYLLRTNAAAWLIALVISAGFNWDTIIADYNFSREKGAFVHLNFLANLSDSALPSLDQPLSKVKSIDQYQERSFFRSLNSNTYHRYYLTPIAYKTGIDLRIYFFKRRWERMSWLEWNYAEDKAYKALKAKEES